MYKHIVSENQSIKGRRREELKQYCIHISLAVIGTFRTLSSTDHCIVFQTIKWLEHLLSHALQLSLCHNVIDSI